MARIALVLALSLLATTHAGILARPRSSRPLQASPSGLLDGPVPSSPQLAMVIPGDSLAEIVLVDGSVNFLSIYSGVLTLRILLSWFPQAQGVALLRPIFTVSDVYLNLFRGVIPAIAGLDISPIAAFFVLNLLTTSVASLGATRPGEAPERPRMLPQVRPRQMLQRARAQLAR